MYCIMYMYESKVKVISRKLQKNPKNSSRKCLKYSSLRFVRREMSGVSGGGGVLGGVAVFEVTSKIVN